MKNSVCGVCCSNDCQAYQKDCIGCNELEGKISWATLYGKDLCPIFECVQEKGLISCKDCGKSPCKIWFSTKNPNASEDEFISDIENRIKNLNN